MRGWHGRDSAHRPDEDTADRVSAAAPPRPQRGTPRWPASHARSRESSTARSLAPLIVLLTVIGLVLAAIGVGQIPGVPSISELISTWTARTGSGPMDRSTPTRITIPSLGVRADTVEVGKAGDGSIATPDRDPQRAAGWYRLGPAPGELGTAVIVGHVDTASRPAVFAKLSEVRRGKLIEVTRADGRTATFTVDSVERFPKTSFPADRVFADAADRPRLVLVTCGGKWVGGDVGYADNIIVFATLA